MNQLFQHRSIFIILSPSWTISDKNSRKSSRKGHLPTGSGAQIRVLKDDDTIEAQLTEDPRAEDRERRKRAKAPETIGLQTKPEVALGQIRSAMAEGIAPAKEIAAVVAEKAAIAPHTAWLVKMPALPDGYRPRG